MIKVFSEYLQLAQAGKVDFLACPMHQEDAPAVFPLTHKQLGDDGVILECYACHYKLVPGTLMYDQLIKVLEKMSPEK